MLLTVKEAAGRLGMSKSALYKSADSYPFTVRDGRRLRFSSRGIERWITRRTGP
jgi:excisionase family DNA binding protein